MEGIKKVFEQGTEGLRSLVESGGEFITNSKIFEYKNLVMIGLLLVVFVVVFVYLKPDFISAEGFSTAAVDPVLMPKCVQRDAEAQNLLSQVNSVVVKNPENVQAFGELQLILSKFLCMDADITGQGAGVYSTYSLPFNTYHDMEPVASFVGRCLNNSLKERDIVLTLDKLEKRGAELIKGLGNCTMEQKTAWIGMLHNIATRTASAVNSVCLKPHSSMDRPAGVRDPGYFDTAGISGPATYQETGNIFHM
jgi:hypothetical protein